MLCDSSLVGMTKAVNSRINTISGYKIDQRCEVIFFQDDDKNHCIAFATELFFEEILEKKNE